MDKDQILAMKRQLEEEFRMDMAALERLERRFLNHKENAPVASAPPPPNNVQVIETRTMPSHKPEPKSEEPPQPGPDELEGTLRSMFSSYRK